MVLDSITGEKDKSIHLCVEKGDGRVQDVLIWAGTTAGPYVLYSWRNVYSANAVQENLDRHSMQFLTACSAVLAQIMSSYMINMIFFIELPHSPLNDHVISLRRWLLTTVF